MVNKPVIRLRLKKSLPAASTKSKTANITAPRRKNTGGRKYGVSKSFKLAYNKLTLKKEVRFTHTDLTSSTNTLADSMIITNITSVSHGTQMNERIGKGIYITGVNWRGSVGNNDTKSKVIRLILLKEKNHGNLNTTTLADLLHNYAYTETAPNQLQQTARLSINRDDYVVLFDKVRKVPVESEGGLFFNYWIKVGKRVTYDMAATTATCNNGFIYAISLLCELDNVTTTATAITGSLLRVFYKDSN